MRPSGYPPPDVLQQEVSNGQCPASLPLPLPLPCLTDLENRCGCDGRSSHAPSSLRMTRPPSSYGG
jgi:hypothetical protein